MSELELIETTLRKVALRRRLDRAWSAFWVGLFAGAICWLVLLATFKLLPIPWEPVAAALGLVPVMAGIGFLIGWWRQPSLEETARWVDLRARLQERLSTAWELKQAGNPWGRLVLADAAEHAGRMDARRLLPWQLPWVTRWLVLVLAVGAGLGFVPEYRSKEYLQRKREAEIIKDTGKQIAVVARRQLERRPPSMEPARESLQSVATLGDQLQRVKLTRNEALKDLASVTEKLKQEALDLAKNPALKRLEQAARNPTGGSDPSSSAQKQLETLQKSGNQAGSNPEALEKLKKELQKLQEAAAGLSAKDGAAGQQARENLAKSLASLGKQAKDLGASLPSLEAAIEALEANQVDFLLRELNVALNDLEKMKELAKALQQMQAQVEKMGKDLAEQLERGQAEAALETLGKMIEALKTAQLTPEQLQKILEEVQRAVDPGKFYGKVGQCLGQACSSMKNGQRPEAALALAEAAKELEKLLEQLGDAQGLAATLEALQKAQMCIGNCQGWGQCLGPPGFNPNGRRPGRGVGTWAEENGWLYDGSITERWDNSGIIRPDMDPKGHTDRGDGELADTVAPTKLRGQFSPGGTMPSITLKGVSVKGQSTVAFEEAALAAQKEAQSALNQDQVPRAYRGSVRDYFDDLKE